MFAYRLVSRDMSNTALCPGMKGNEKRKRPMKEARTCLESQTGGGRERASA